MNKIRISIIAALLIAGALIASCVARDLSTTARHEQLNEILHDR